MLKETQAKKFLQGNCYAINYSNDLKEFPGARDTLLGKGLTRRQRRLYLFFMTRLYSIALSALAAFVAAGCSTAPKSPMATSQQYYLDPAVEMHHYRTYGFLQVTACRYLPERLPSDPALQADWLKHHKGKDEPVSVHFTDEVVWRVLQLEMEKKGYMQVDPSQADLLVAYYGGPRPQTPMRETRFEPCPFDSYFARNELTEKTFFVDVVDSHRGTLLYRGWDNSTYTSTFSPEPGKVLHSTHSCIDFFPSAQ